MAHDPTRVRTFIEEISKGNYVIPHFQRSYDWNPGMVADLFVSILHQYYAGTILLWAMEDKDREQPMWDPLWSATKSQKPTKAVLDGQQRLTSLYYALFAPNQKFPARQTYYTFYVNLDKYLDDNEDESITYRYHASQLTREELIARKKYLLRDGLFLISFLPDEEFMNSPFIQAWLHDYSTSRSDRFPSEKLSVLFLYQKLMSVMSYSFLTETLENKTIREICSIFANINSKGKPLTVFDLLNAFLYPYGISLRKKWDELDNQALKNVDTEMRIQVLKLMSLHKQKYCSSRYLYNLIPETQIMDRHRNAQVLIPTAVDFEKEWDLAITYSEKARKKVMSSGEHDFGAIKPTFIPNTTLIPVLGALQMAYDLSLKHTVSLEDFTRKISRWYWSAAISQDYSGSSDTVMAKDYTDMIRWFGDDTAVPDRVNEIDEISIEEQLDLSHVSTANNSQYSSILGLLSLKGAKDFFTGRILGNFPIEEINDHHIFPVRSKVKFNGKVDVNSILNRTLIYDKTNQSISNRKPSEYLELMYAQIGDRQKTHEILASHFINEQAVEAMKQNDFSAFCVARELEIKKAIKSVLGYTIPKTKTLIQPGKDFDNEELYISYLSSASEYLYLLDPYYNKNSLRLLGMSLQRNKALQNIRILSKSTNIDHDFYQLFKKLKQQLALDGINLELKVITNPNDFSKLHNRYLITKNHSYDFISADTALRGQLSHVKEVEDMTLYFDDFWQKGITIMDFISRLN